MASACGRSPARNTERRSRFGAGARNFSNCRCNFGRMVRAEYSSDGNSHQGTILSASTVTKGTRSRSAASFRHRSGSRSGFSSPTSRRRARRRRSAHVASQASPTRRTKPGAAARQRAGNLHEAFEHELEMPLVGSREMGVEREEHDHRQSRARCASRSAASSAGLSSARWARCIQ